MKKLILIFTLFILLAFSIKASSEADWLVSKSSEWDIEETAYAVLALKTEPSTYRSQIFTAISKLKTNSNSCILDNTCDIKEAALSILAMKDSITSTELNTYSTWLLNSASTQYTGETQGWLVQIVSPEVGRCTLNNTETKKYQEINVQKDYTPWVQVSSDVLTSTTKSLELDCSLLQSTNLILSLIQRKQESGITHYYIKQEEHGKSKMTVEFGNPCWGPSYKSTCDKDVTSLVLYTLKQAQKTADSTWLSKQSLTPLQNAFLYKTTADTNYLDALKASQNQPGDWNQDVYTTAMIAYLIKPNTILNKSYSWIQTNKNPSKNCWPSLACNIITTSAVLMAQPSTTSTITDIDNDKIDDTWEDNNCYNKDCDPNDDPDNDGLTNYQEYIHGTDPYDEDTDDDGYTDKEEVDANTDPLNPEDHPTTTSGGTTKEACPEDGDCTTIHNCPGKCDNLGRCVDIGDDCPETTAEECIYGEKCTTDVGCDGICNEFETCEDSPGDGCPISDTRIEAPQDKEKPKEKGHGVFFWFLMVLLLLIILAGGSYLAYKKGLLKFKFGKKPPKKTFPAYIPKLKPTPKKEEYKPSIRYEPRKSPVRKYMEKDLERSMKEMEELLKK